MSRVGIYVHIPFCKQKCPYCDFYSLGQTADLKGRYTDTVSESMESYRGMNLIADTVYFGGGTPTLLDSELLCRILAQTRSVFSLTQDAEITLEANPGSVSEEQLNQLKQAGFNRISFGMQSAVSSELQKLGRCHTPEQVRLAIAAAKKAGFSNLSVDLMLGIPEQTVQSLDGTLRFVEELSVSHVSAYLLKIEPGTAFDCEQIRTLLPQEDEVCDLYLHCCERLEQIGFYQYEISNFARSGRESRHNLKYWNCEDYLGFGPSAHSYWKGKRFYYDRDLASFLDAKKRRTLPETDRVDYQEEYLMMRFRLNQGVSLAELKRRFQIEPDDMLGRCRRYLSAGFMEQKGDFLSLTRTGFLVSNSILADLI